MVGVPPFLRQCAFVTKIVGGINRMQRFNGIRRSNAAPAIGLCVASVLILFLVGCGGSSTGGTTPNFPIVQAEIPASFFGFTINKPCNVADVNTAGSPCDNTESHGFPGLPLTWSRSLDEDSLKWSDIALCDPTGSVCPKAGSGCSKDGLGLNGAPCPATALIPNCVPDALAPDDPTNCAYTWAIFDFWNPKFAAHNVDWMYTAFFTPDYLSIRGSRCVSAGQADFGPDATCVGTPDVCLNLPLQEWGCDPPSDIDATPGSGAADGSDQNLIWFITAMMKHMQANSEKLKYWEVWNEPDDCEQWNHMQPGASVTCAETNFSGGPSDGTTAQLVRMATDARSIIPKYLSGVLISSPPIAGVYENSNYMYTILKGGGSAFDVVGFHGYFSGPTGCPSQCPVPELLQNILPAAYGAVNTAGDITKPVLDTEFSWGAKTNVTNLDMRIAFTARSYILQEADYPFITRVNWFVEDAPINLIPNPINNNEPTGGTGEFWASGTTNVADGCTVPDLVQGGFDCPAGLAMQQLVTWTVGASFVGPCTCTASPNGGSCSAVPPTGIWQCPISRSGGYAGLLVWDSTYTTFPCGDASCGATSFPVPFAYSSDWQDLTGKVTPLNGTTAVVIGAKPILIENQNTGK